MTTHADLTEVSDHRIVADWASLFGDTHAHGTEGVHFFTRAKATTARWLDPSDGVIELGVPQNK